MFIEENLRLGGNLIKPLILSTREDGAVYNLVRCLQKINTNGVVIGGPNTSPLSRSRYCKAFFPVQDETFVLDEPKLLELIESVSQNYGCDILIPSCFTAACFISRNRSQLEKHLRIFPVADEKLLERLHNKWSFNLLLIELGLPTPKTVILENDNIAGEMNLAYPVIVKPLSMDNSLGIETVRSYDELNVVIQKKAFPCILQEYLWGEDVDINLLAVDGEIKAWTIQREVEHGIEFFHDPKVLELARRLIKAIGYSGLTHLDMRYDKRSGTLYLIDFNPCDMDYLSCLAGINYADIGIKLLENAQYHFQEIKSPKAFLVMHSVTKTLSYCTRDRDALKQLFSNYIFSTLQDPLYALHRGSAKRIFNRQEGQARKKIRL